MSFSSTGMFLLQDPIEQALTPRDDVGANERGRKGEKDAEKGRKRYAEGRVERERHE